MEMEAMWDIISSSVQSKLAMVKTTSEVGMQYFWR